MAKLGDVFNLQMGKTPARANSAYWTDGTNDWVSIADLSSYEKYVDGTKEKITDLAVQESGIKKVPANTVIMSFKLSLGKTAITKTPVYTNEAIMAFLPSGKYDVYPDYFFHLFSGKDWSDGTNRAVMGVTLNKATLSNIEIDIPPLNEQRRIAAVLDKVTDLIAQRRAQLDKLDLLVKSRFVEMFGDPIKNDHGWDVISLIDATTKIGSGATPKGGQASYQSSGISLIRSMNVYDGNFVHRELAHISDSQAKLLDNVSVNKNDILFNITGASIARACIVPEDILPARVNQHVAIIRCKPSSFNPIFVNQQLINVSYKKLLLSIGESGGATRQAITKQDLSNTSIIAPPIIFQNQYAKFVTHIQNIKSKVQCSLAELVVLKESLMQKYFE